MEVHLETAAASEEMSAAIAAIHESQAKEKAKDEYEQNQGHCSNARYISLRNSCPNYVPNSIDKHQQYKSSQEMRPKRKVLKKVDRDPKRKKTDLE